MELLTIILLGVAVGALEVLLRPPRITGREMGECDGDLVSSRGIIKLE